MRRRALAGFALTLVVATAALAQAGSNGHAADDAATAEGCTCHSPTPNAGTVLRLTGLPKEYDPGKAYALVLTSTTDVIPNPTRNLGGFLAIAAAGSLAPTAGEQAWYRSGLLNDSRPFVGHNLQGAEKNRFQEWRFTWTAPDPGVGTVAFEAYVNRVNGDALATPDDHWNKMGATIAGPAPNPPPSSSSPSASSSSSSPPSSSSPSSSPSSPSSSQTPSSSSSSSSPSPAPASSAQPPPSPADTPPDDGSRLAPAPWLGATLAALAWAARAGRRR